MSNTVRSSTYSAANTRGINTSFGTNSPPLEATGSDKPMGMSSVSGSHNAGHVPDKDQRKDYFPGRVSMTYGVHLESQDQLTQRSSEKLEGAEKTESASKIKQ